MRIWSIHPKYLDSKGLVALWRETLLAKNVLLGKTKGYKNHPQLERFKNTKNPLLAIDTYLSFVYLESVQRGYTFNPSKIGQVEESIKIEITNGQLDYEFKHLLKKLKSREPNKYKELKTLKALEPHPIFKAMPGEIQSWEKV